MGTSFKKIKKYLKFDFCNRKSYKTKNYENVDWVFIATPDSTHKSNRLFLKKRQCFLRKAVSKKF